VLEDDELNLEVARHLTTLGERLSIRVIYKASFDKANRASLGSPRGPGIKVGGEALNRVRSETGLPVLTDVHEAWQAEQIAASVDALQVPAFLCRQTDLLTAVGATGLAVNIKRGQWMPPHSMGGAVEKVRAAGGGDIAVTERGTFFGYGDLVVDMRNFARLRQATGAAVLFDATHSVQQPGAGSGGTSGGGREWIPDLLHAAAGAGVDGFFLETHPEPAEAPSDSASMWPLAELSAIVSRAVDLWHVKRRDLEG
jgi:2-dehydro-3-deoxyphosphooctonate aldolase (KDO 8-P synthase)